MTNRNEVICCSWCEQTHHSVPLRAGERAICVRCGKTLGKGSFWGPHAPIAFASAAVILAIPAVLLPFVTLSKFGSSRPSRLLDAAVGMWDAGMPELAAVVFLCGAIAPALLLALLLAVRELRERGEARRRWLKFLHHLQHWAMPEVQVLAVLVAFSKLGSLVSVEVGPGLWCYAAMAFSLLAAWRSVDLDPANDLVESEAAS